MSNQPPIEVPQGAIRLNTDSQKLEFFAQDRWYQFATDSPVLTGGARGLACGGQAPSHSNGIEFITIATLGNAIDFADLSRKTRDHGATGSRTRAVNGGGQAPGPANTNVIDATDFASRSNAIDISDLTVARRNMCATGSQTRGIFAAGQTPTLQNVIDFMTIQSTANAVDFGDLTTANKAASAVSSPTRALIAEGLSPATAVNTIDFITISTRGDAQDFGDLTVARYATNNVSSSTRAVFMNGTRTSPSLTGTNIMDFVTMNTLGNAVDFGDGTQSQVSNAQSASSCVRGVRMGGTGPGVDGHMDYINIATKAHAEDFGTLTTFRTEGAGCSNGHGGL